MNRLILLLCLTSTVGFAETIEEKKAGMVQKELMGGAPDQDLGAGQPTHRLPSQAAGKLLPRSRRPQ